MTKFIAVKNDSNIIENVTIVKDDYILVDNEIEVLSTNVLNTSYISETGKFREPKPYPSWIESSDFTDENNEILGWNPPVAKPEPDSDGDTTRWEWDEDTTSWVVV